MESLVGDPAAGRRDRAGGTAVAPVTLDPLARIKRQVQHLIWMLAFTIGLQICTLGVLLFCLR